MLFDEPPAVTRYDGFHADVITPPLHCFSIARALHNSSSLPMLVSWLCRGDWWGALLVGCLTGGVPLTGGVAYWWGGRFGLVALSSS